MNEAKIHIPNQNKFSLENDLADLMSEIGFNDPHDIIRRYYYTHDQARGVVAKGTYKGEKAMLKVHTRHEWAREPIDLDAFNKCNKSNLIKGIELLDYQTHDGEKMWMVTKLIEGQNWDSLPEIPFLTDEQKEKLTTAYAELLDNMCEPIREKQWIESRGSAHYTEARLWKWYNIGSEVGLIDSSHVNQRLQKTLEIVRKDFDKIPMTWVHGHFCPSQITEKNNVLYLHDWGHTGYYPSLYEPAFTVWNLSFAAARQNMPFEKWLEETEKWKDAFRNKIADKLQLSEEQFNHFFDLEMLERTCGNLLVHAGAETTWPEDERMQVLELNSKLTDYYLDKLK